MKKVCRTCKFFAKGDTCPVCKGNQFSTTWKGRIVIINPEKSEIAKKLSVTHKGEYAIKVS